jgi:hypothetical protein
LKRRLAIQHIRIHWGKSGRGAKWGTVRNAVPRERPFHAPFDSDPGWYHHITHDHGDSYAPVEAMHELGKIENWRVPVHTRIEDDRLGIRFNVAHRDPYRPHMVGWIARLPFGQRLTFMTNHKADGDHERWYWEEHFHVGWSDMATLDLPLFREIDERVLLY